MNSKYEILTPHQDETFEEYRRRVYRLKYSGDVRISWWDLTHLFEDTFGVHRDESIWRKEAKRLVMEGELTLTEDIFTQITQEDLPVTTDLFGQETEPVTDSYNRYVEARKERIKAADERTQAQAYLRQVSREETLREIALQAAKEMTNKKLLAPPIKRLYRNSTKEAILQLSDWHYGLVVNNHWNHYSPEICKERVAALLEETVDFCERFDVTTLHVVNLSDLICGRIHLQLRIESRMEVVSQTIEVSEILSEFISELTNRGIQVEYYDCLDNHSRVEPNKKSSLDLESMAKVITKFLKCRLENNPMVNINENEYDDDIITFNVLGYKVGGVHGHKDKPSKVVENLTLMLKENFDLILTAHLHHFSCDEQNEVVVVSNGSLMGTDDHAKNLRYTSKPSQNLILVTDKSVVDYIHRVVLD